MAECMNGTLGEETDRDLPSDCNSGRLNREIINNQTWYSDHGNSAQGTPKKKKRA